MKKSLVKCDRCGAEAAATGGTYSTPGNWALVRILPNPANFPEGGTANVDLDLCDECQHDLRHHFMRPTEKT